MRLSSKYLMLALIGVCNLGAAKTFRIAAMYPTVNLGHINCTCSQEAACITKAVVIQAKERGLDVTVDFIDMTRNSLKTLAVAEKIAQEQYDAAVGTLISNDALLAAPVLEKAGIPFVVPTASNPRVTAGRSLVARIAFNDYRQAYLLARFAKDHYEPRRIGIIRNISQPYSDFLGTEFSSQIHRILPRATVFEHTVMDGFKDFKSLVTDLAAEKVDLLFVPISQVLMSSLYVEVVNRGLSLTLLGSDIVEGQLDFIKTLGSVSPKINFVFPKHWNGKLEGPEAENYRTLYTTHCGQYPMSMSSTAAYDAIMLMIRTLQRYPKARGKEFIARLKSVHYEGMNGAMKYGPDGEPMKPLELFTVRNGETVYWRRYE